MLLLLAFALPARADSPVATWGAETSKTIEATFWLPQRGLYADEGTAVKPPPDRPAFMWGCGVQLSALVAATRAEPKTYAPQLERYAKALRVYWTEQNGVGGYDVLPGPKPPDRYYDDNAWIVLALAEAYDVTRDPQYLTGAEATFRFVMSGEDDKLGGGLYWREQEKTSKNTCINAPAAVGALRLYQLTRKPNYLAVARRLYAWTNAHLQDTDGLYWDNIRMDGRIEKTKWSYNTALMIRANALFHAVTHQKSYLDEAERIARAAETHWVRPETGGIADGGAFAHLLTESFLALYDEDQDKHWLQIARRAVQFVHDKLRDQNGFYGSQWDTPQTAPLDKVKLLDQASVARAYWIVSRYP